MKFIPKLTINGKYEENKTKLNGHMDTYEIYSNV